jgi:hypothetical protein
MGQSERHNALKKTPVFAYSSPGTTLATRNELLPDVTLTANADIAMVLTIRLAVIMNRHRGGSEYAQEI